MAKKESAKCNHSEAELARADLSFRSFQQKWKSEFPKPITQVQTLWFPWGWVVNIQLYPDVWIGKPFILNRTDVGLTEFQTQQVNDAKPYHQVGNLISRHGSERILIWQSNNGSSWMNQWQWNQHISVYVKPCVSPPQMGDFRLMSFAEVQMAQQWPPR